MTQDDDKTKHLSSNPFIARSQQYDAKFSQYGLDEFDDVFARSRIKSEAEQRIRDENIIDDDEKHRIYDEIKKQYREYLSYIRAQIKTQSEPGDKTEQSIEEDDDAEFRRGYDACIASLREQEERHKTKYHQGWQAAWKEQHDRDVLKIRAEVEQQLGQSETSPDSDLLEDNAITRIREELKSLDERLRRIEKYTEE